MTPENKAALEALERIEVYIDDCETMCVSVRDDIRFVEKHIRLTAREPIDLSGMYMSELPYRTQDQIYADNGWNNCLDTLKQKYPERFK